MAVPARPPVIGYRASHVINGGNPLSVGLVFLTLPGTGDSPIDLVSNRKPTEVASVSLTFPVDQLYRTCMNLIGAVAGDGLNYGTYFAIPSGSSTYTMAGLAKAPSQAKRETIFWQGDETLANSNQINLTLNGDSSGNPSSGLVSLYDYNAGFNAQATSTASQVDGNWHTFVGRRNGTSSTSATVWRDGVNVTSSQSGGGGTQSTAFPVYALGAKSTSSGYTVDGPVAIVCAWGRALTDDEIYRWCADPFQVISVVPTLTY